MPLGTHLERAALNEDDRVEETVADINDRHVERVRAELRLDANKQRRAVARHAVPHVGTLHVVLLNQWRLSSEAPGSAPAPAWLEAVT